MTNGLVESTRMVSQTITAVLKWLLVHWWIALIILGLYIALRFIKYYRGAE